jgi:hypothetical protein
MLAKCFACAFIAPINMVKSRDAIAKLDQGA